MILLALPPAHDPQQVFPLNPSTPIMSDTISPRRHSLLTPMICLSVITLFTASVRAGANNDDQASGKASVQTDHPWSTTLLGFGAKTNDAYTDGSIFLTVPLWSTLGQGGSLGGDYLFLEPYTSIGDGGEVAASLGLSYRHLFSDEPVSALQKKGIASFMEEGWFLGGSLFVDNLNTQHDNSFWQLGVGLEAGTRYLEVRGNYYIPLSGEELVERSESTQISRSSSTRLVQSGGGASDPYATGNQIAQDVNLTTSAITTTRTTTTRTVTELFEEGMEGWDVEAAFLMPWLDQWVDLKLIGGYYSFDNQPFGPQSYGTGKVHGFKAGAELRPVPAVVLSGYWYEDKRLTGGNWTVGAQLQIPLDRTWKDAFKMRRRHLVEHLAEPVHRQNDAIKVGNKKEEKSITSTSVKRVTRVISQTQQHLVLADDVIFVNNGPTVSNGIQAGSDVTGTGTAEQPKATIQAGATVAQTNSTTTARVWNVYTQGSVAGYTENVSATTGSVNFIGSGQAIAGQGGKSFGSGPMPLVNGNISAVAIPFLGVNGYTIQAGGINGIVVTNVAGLVARNNIIDGADNGILILTNGSNTGSATLTGNTVNNSTTRGLLAQSNDDASLTLTASSNAFDTSGSVGIELQSFTTSDLTATLTGNTIRNTTNNGLLAVSHDTSSLTLTAASNTIGTTNNGLVAQSMDASTFLFTATGNSIDTASGNGMILESINTSILNATLNGNTITNITGQGILGGPAAGTLNINGTISNTINAVGGFRYEALGAPSGIFIINDTPAPANVNFP